MIIAHENRQWKTYRYQNNHKILPALGQAYHNRRSRGENVSSIGIHSRHVA